MESCDQSLKDIIHDWPQLFPKSEKQSMLVLEYLMLTLFYVRILHNVNRLHSRKPPIIHRDLKPGNILIKYKTKIGNKASLRVSLRLCDFGLAKFNEFHHDADFNHSYHASMGSHTRIKGSPNYIAPEVDSGHYSSKTDIFSLGVIGKELFGYK